MSLHCSSQGRGEDIVLLHGWGMNSAVWKGLLPQLQERYRVHCIDLPGHGASEDVEAGLDAWLEVMEDSLPEHFYLCGWSLGGLLALAIRRRWPQRVKSLVLLSTSPRFLEAAGWPALPAAQLEQFGLGLAKDIEATLRQFIALQFLGVPGSRAVQRELWQALQEQGVASQQGLQQGLQLLQQLDLRESYADAPCAVVLGGRDKLVSAALLESMQVLNLCSHIELWPQAAHAPHLLEPARVAEFIDTYINESQKP